MFSVECLVHVVWDTRVYKQGSKNATGYPSFVEIYSF